MELGRDLTCLQVEHQFNGRRMKWGPSQINSNTTTMLPFSFDLSLVLQRVVKDIDWASKWHSSIGVGHDFRTTENLTWSSLQLLGWCLIVNRICCPNCIGSKVRCNCFLPSMLGMNHAGSGRLLKLSDVSFGHTCLKVSIVTGVSENLS
jgi:hypothetical protein